VWRDGELVDPDRSDAARVRRNGNPIYATPHHPAKPRRQRRPRFAEGPLDDRPR
jgi:hypothetical protein